MTRTGVGKKSLVKEITRTSVGKKLLVKPDQELRLPVSCFVGWICPIDMLRQRGAEQVDHARKGARAGAVHSQDQNADAPRRRKGRGGDLRFGNSWSSA